MLALLFILIAIVFAGPVSSGAIFLLLPGGGTAAHHDLPEPFEPLHKGHVDTSTGLYTREDEDLVVSGTPPLVLRRTYYSGWRSSRQFGINTTHSGEAYLLGDPKAFQWVALVTATGHRINFRRITPGTWLANALFEHTSTATQYQGARVGWTGFWWTMRLRDGSSFSFRACGARGDLCSMIQSRDAEGHTINYTRDVSGRLLRMEAAGSRWIAFEYNDRGLIGLASDSAGRAVRYTYDERWRLSRVNTFDGKLREYTYTNRDEMRTITDPGIRLENTYDAASRVIRQDNWFPDRTEPYTFRMEYVTRRDAVLQTHESRSDGYWSKYTFDASRYMIAESWGERDKEVASVSYERDPATIGVVAMTVTCRDRSGRQAPHYSRVQPGYEDWIRWDLVQTHCSWSEWIRNRYARRQERQPQ